MLNLDMTFCSGLRCAIANTCARWTVNLEKLAKKEKWEMENGAFSVAQFADHNGKCTHYLPVEEGG